MLRPRSPLLAGSLLALSLAACNSSGDAGPRADSALGTFFRGTAAEPTTIDPALLTPPTPCPEVRILPDTESIRREDGDGGPEALFWQASITRTARECVPADGGAVTVRVGVAGRVIEGARGAPDRVELPLRIAVREGDDVTYSRLHNVLVAMPGPSEDWAFVEESIRIAAPDGADIVVGFDGT